MFLRSMNRFLLIRKRNKNLITYQHFFNYSVVGYMKWEKEIQKKNQTKLNKKNRELGQTKNSAKLVLFIFGIGPIIGIIIFLFSKGFFNSPNL